MKSNYFKKLLGGAIMAFSLILGFAASSAVKAQYPYPQYPYPDDRYRQQDDRYRRDQQDRWRRDRDRNRRDDYSQDRWGRGQSWDGYPNWGGGFDLRQTALNAGYNAGVKEGRNDRNRRRGYGYGYTDFGRFSSYRSADKDYNGRFGDRELYRRYFRMAFENGYADGLRGY
jgi:hypothetical protein